MYNVYFLSSDILHLLADFLCTAVTEVLKLPQFLINLVFITHRYARHFTIFEVLHLLVQS
jgi:hypothetical protein